MSGYSSYVNIIGAGLAGLSAAIRLAETGIRSRLISVQPSERAQSVLAEGGINGALDTMGEGDSWLEHYADTEEAGCHIVDSGAVRGLCEGAPGIIRWLDSLGAAFNKSEGAIQLRKFGGQKKKRTAYAGSITGKAIMTALIDEARKYEASGLIARYPRHELVSLITGRGDGSCSGSPDVPAECTGCDVRNIYTGEISVLSGMVILAFGGLNGLFPGHTTGTTANTADAAAICFMQGVAFSNLEMIQYHPTTFGIPGKRCLISEAARSEGARLYTLRNGHPWYFMEEKYPELGNLMPRDVVSREMYFVTHEPSCGGQVYLDCTGIKPDVWKKKLSELRKEITEYLAIDPAGTPVPVEPGIHYFMGGIDVDIRHSTNMPGLFAAGECCSAYHGANRLGGNSMLGAIYGGLRAAGTAAGLMAHGSGDCAAAEQDIRYKRDPGQHGCGNEFMDSLNGAKTDSANDWHGSGNIKECYDAGVNSRKSRTDSELDKKVCEILLGALGIVRNEDDIKKALEELEALKLQNTKGVDLARLSLAEAMLLSAELRKESRGAHCREDYPEADERFRGMTFARMDKEGIHVELKKAD